MKMIVIALVALILTLNLWSTIRSVTVESSLHHERFAQLFLIWLLPVIGALVVLQLLRKNPEKSTGTYPYVHRIGEMDSSPGPSHGGFDGGGH
jgi:hypothetical protein